MDATDTPIRTVMTSPVRVIDGERSVREAATILDAEGIGSVVVRGDGERGLLTKSDIVAGLRGGLDPERTPVANLMSTPLVTVAPDVDLRTAVDLMADRGIKHLVVAEGTELVGVVTTTDLVGAVAAGSDAVVGSFVGLYDRGGPNTYECPRCGSRVETDERSTTCPNCGEPMRNISVPRE